MTPTETVYSKPFYYDLVFRRDVERELDFLAAAAQSLAGRPPASLLDLACGPGYHARAAARRGWRAHGLDFSPEMVDYAARSAAEEGVAADFLQGDMRGFALPVPVDVALCAYDSVDVMATDDDMLAHLDAVAANLGDGGLYLIQSMHPRDCAPTRYGPYRHVGSDGTVSVELTIGGNRPVFHPVTGIGQVEYRLRVNAGDEETILSDVSHERHYTPEVLALLAARSPLRVAGWFGDFNLGCPLDAESTEMLLVLQKRS